MPDDETIALREHLRSRAELVRARTMRKNRVHGLLHRRGIQTPQCDLFTWFGRNWLNDLELDQSNG